MWRAFKYDTLDRRYEKKYKDILTKFVWDGNTPLHEWVESETEKVPSGDLGAVTWVFDADSFVPSAKLVGDKSYSIISDYLGTPCQAYSETGAKVWEYEQKSYGGSETPPLGVGGLGFIPFRYQGQYEDVETGLYYNRFRYYSPDEGCYISQDPIGLVGGLELYNYVHDSNAYIDTFGYYSDLNPSGMGHHVFPRAIGKKLGIPELSEHGSISWYPNKSEGSSVLHGDMHDALRREGLPIHGSKYEGTTSEAFKKMNDAYKGIEEKGFLKLPGTNKILLKDVTPQEAINAIGKMHNEGTLPKAHH